MVAAAGCRSWPQSVAHLSVLVAPHCRGRRLARAVASAAVAHALDAGLLPQWRARPYPSQRVACPASRRPADAPSTVGSRSRLPTGASSSGPGPASGAGCTRPSSTASTSAVCST
ncbi:GNAT family N-acetyltransferase [Streptomyces sp. NPDC000609]|uniref:GNAT family N-acetyltransferase n=1 Tax=Streptomyces sp. NPDC000609 TaxID=3160957 RepID=UPI003390CBF9